MERRKKKVVCLILSCFTLLLNISIAKAEALPDVMSGSATIADCVMSYYAMAGCAVANTEWINTLYDSLGSSFGTVYDFAENGMLTINNDGTWQATTALTDAIENSSAYTSLGLDQVFNVTAEEAAAAGGVAASGAGTLAGAVGGLASTGLLTVAAGVTAAYWGGIAIGTLAAHLLGLYDKPIEQGVPMTELLNSVPNGANCIAMGKKSLSARVFYVENCRITCDSESKIYLSGSPNQVVTMTKVLSNRPDPSYKSYTLNENGRYVGDTTGGNSNYSFVMPVWDVSGLSTSEYNEFKSKFLNGIIDIPERYSPDIIGENGNQQGSYENGNYVIPDVKPQIDSGTQAGVPLTMNDWLNFANSVANNNSKTNPLPDNSALFDSLMDAIVRVIPNPSPDPDPNPNPNPDPTPDPYHPPVVTPVPDPDYDPVPDNPDQPDYESEKQKQTEPVPDEVPTGAPWTTDGLLDKFPFCIPKDMIDMVKQFSTGSRQAPYISWRFNPPGTPVDYTFNLDLSDFEDAATLIRMLELAAFIVGLAFATRYLIGAS